MKTRIFLAFQVLTILAKNDESALKHDYNHDLYDDSYGRKFVIPKRINFGTYKPSSYTEESRCSCDDMPAPIVIYNEMAVLSDYYEWKDTQLEDASQSTFKNMKKRAEVSVCTGLGKIFIG